MNFKTLWMAAIAATALTGCSDDEAATATVDLADTRIIVNAGVNNLGTRAGYGPGKLEEGALALYLTTAGTEQGEARYNCENKKVGYDASSGWKYEGSPIYWKSGNASVEYYAYMPYRETAPTTLSVSTMQSEATFKDEDFLYAAKATASANSDGIGIDFSHKLSKLDITLSRGTELAEGLTFQSVVLAGCATSTTIDLPTGTVATAATGTDSITTLATTADTYESLLVPQTVNPLTVIISTTAGSDTKTYKYTSTTSQVFEPGILYTLPITVGRDKVEVGAITAKPWNDSQTSGELETE